MRIIDSNKVDGSTAETCCDAKDSSRRQSTSAIGGISSSNIKKLITSTIKKRSEERKVRICLLRFTVTVENNN